VLEDLKKEGIKYLFASNGDNLAAIADFSNIFKCV